VIVDNFLDALGNAAKKLLPVEDGRDFAAHVVKECEGVILLDGRENQRLRDGIGVSVQG
jgi:hypothetical protein